MIRYLFVTKLIIFTMLPLEIFTGNIGNDEKEIVQCPH